MTDDSKAKTDTNSPADDSPGEENHMPAPSRTNTRPLPSSPLLFDIATGLACGGRETQEDAVLADAPQGGATALLALADGMGGHSGGSIASRVAVSTAMAIMAAQRCPDGRIDGDIPDHLATAAGEANAAVRAGGEASGLHDIGTTLVLAVIQDNALHWISVGDSRLFLIRDGSIRRLNEDHSLATQLDLLVQVGEMTAEEALAHPGRSCLTSALGSASIERLDCPEDPIGLQKGDTILLASDGVISLSETDIAAPFVASGPAGAPERIAELLERIAALEDPEQDNTSIVALRVTTPRVSSKTRPATQSDRRSSRVLRPAKPVTATHPAPAGRAVALSAGSGGGFGPAPTVPGRMNLAAGLRGAFRPRQEPAE